MSERLPKRIRSTRGMTLVELLVSTSVFSVLLALSMTLVTRWMNVSRVADAQSKAVSDARSAMVDLATDIRSAEIIVTNHNVQLTNSTPPFSPAPPVIDSPVVVYNRDAVALDVLNRETFQSPENTNSILLICPSSATAKNYIAYYTATYQADNITRVGLFRYQWTSTIAVAALNPYAPFILTAKEFSDAAFSVPATGTITIGNSGNTPKIKCLVQDLHYAHTPGYGTEAPKKTSEPRYLFSVSTTQPYANENWLSPFNVEISMSVVYPVKSLQGLDYDKIDDRERQFSTVTIRTFALAKNVPITK